MRKGGCGTVDSHGLTNAGKLTERWPCVLSLVAVFLFSPAASAQTGAPARETPDSAPRRYHLELTSFDYNVSNGFGHWAGGGLSLSYKWNERLSTAGEIVAQRRPGETQPLLGGAARIEWSPWFYTDLALSGGGPNDPAAFFPRVRYDWTANLKPPWAPGLILNGGFTQLFFGDPVRGHVFRSGAVYYWRRFVFQGTLFLNTSHPGDRKSKSANGAMQYGQEGRYWIGLIGGGGREAWQTLALTPQDAEFTSYSGSVFFRKWLSPAYGIHASYGYMVKRGAYRIHSTEFKFFFDF
ncbi:MAG: YaiO family outer membrane beta-barrel protein [Terriglobia bacterium]